MSMTHGIAYIKVTGFGLLRTLPGAKLKLGGTKRDPVVGASSVHGFAESIEPALLECEISLVPGFSLAALQAVRDATITYEADTGQRYVIRDAFCTETMEVNAGEGGKVPCKFSGQPAEEEIVS
jgi:hypothetical protein